MQPNDFSELDELTEEHLGFAALSEGLGFQKAHVAALNDTAAAVRDDMLAAHTKYGAGAVAAGPAMPATAGSLAGLANLHNKPNTETRKPVFSQAAVKVQADALAENTKQTANSILQMPAAAPLLRISAMLADLFFVSAPLAIALKLNFSAAELRTLWSTESKSFLGFYFAFVVTYFLLSESFGGQSPGKMLFQLHIVEDDKYQKPIGLKLAFARLCSFILGASFGTLGLISALWDSKSRPFHDKVTGSIVRQKK